MLKRQLKFQRARLTAVFLPIAAAILVSAHWLAGAPLQTGDRAQPARTEFNDSIASGLLGQITSGFESRNQNKVLGAFDLASMSDGQLFRQQIVAFFAHTESVRIHVNLVQTSSESGKGTAEVDVEMEAAPRDSNDLPVHKQDRLRFTAANTPAGWKFSDVQPRGFFSLQP
jgi:hypothetical protein